MEDHAEIARRLVQAREQQAQAAAEQITSVAAQDKATRLYRVAQEILQAAPVTLEWLAARNFPEAEMVVTRNPVYRMFGGSKPAQQEAGWKLYGSHTAPVGDSQLGSTTRWYYLLANGLLQVTHHTTGTYAQHGSEHTILSTPELLLKQRRLNLAPLLAGLIGRRSLHFMPESETRDGYN